MSEECNHDCANCSSKCSAPEKEPCNAQSHVKHVIAVVSGKGGVGKSLVTSRLAVIFSRLGYKTAIMDADVTGPSIPKAFGLKQRATGDEFGLYPVLTKTGIRVMSLNLLLENDTDPVVWRGPVIGGTVKQFWTDVIWGDIDYMFIDMPPGTGDVPLTVFQSIPVDGAVVVTTPQQLVEMIVQKAVNMAGLMNVPVLSIVENMSYALCPDCGRKIEIFGASRAAETAAALGIDTYDSLPLDPKLASAADKGLMELCADDEQLASTVKKIIG